MKSFFIIFSLMACVSLSAQTKLEVAAFEKLIAAEKKIQLIDVRTPQEVANGMIEKAINIDFNAADFKTKIEKLDKKKPIAVYCAAGGRSGKTASLLTQMGFKTVYDLTGGMTAWAAKGKKTVKPNR